MGSERSLSSKIGECKKLLLGVVHLGALPGSPLFAGRREVLERALADADALVEGGLDGVIVENFSDVPFHKDNVPPATIAEMAVLTERVRRAIGSDCLLGVNVLRNDARAALAVAAAAGADFIRVNVHTGVMYCDQGTVEGRAEQTLRDRRALGANVEILADVAVKHATVPAGFSLPQSAKDTAYRGLADGLIVTGSGTGGATDLADVRTVRAAVVDRPLFVGSGISDASVADALAIADGAIVGTWLKEDGKVKSPVSLERVRALVSAARRGQRST